jgi:hypothetical protein
MPKIALLRYFLKYNLNRKSILHFINIYAIPNHLTLGILVSLGEKFEDHKCCETLEHPFGHLDCRDTLVIPYGGEDGLVAIGNMLGLVELLHVVTKDSEGFELVVAALKHFWDYMRLLIILRMY